MSTVPQVRIHGVNELQLDQVPAPVCGENDVIVGVHECGICGSDLGYLGMGGLTGPDTPMPLGHELWGKVEQAGANVSHVSVGDDVVVQPMSSGNNIGNGGLEGGFTPQLLVRNAALDPASLLKLPADLPREYGALVEPLAVAQHGANRAQATAVDKAVIYGAGPIGLSLLEVLKYRGLTDIVVVDLSDHRLAVAADLGAVTVRGDDPQLAQKLIDVHGQSEFFGMPMPGSTVYFEATGARPVFEGIIANAGPQARVCLIGVHKEAATVDLVMLLAKEISIISAMGYEDEFEEVLAMLQSGQLAPQTMVTHHYPLSEVIAAFDLARTPGDAIKIIIDCQS